MPADIRAKLSDQENLLPDHHENIDNFVEELNFYESQFKPIGIKMHQYNVETSAGTRKFAIYKANISYCENLQEYHKRVQVFLLWFVDAASYIDDDDDRWDFYFLFELLEGDRYALAGYATVYNFFAYPDHIRPRISQILVLPPFQRMGKFLKNVFSLRSNF